jgi:tRNA pseudouridine38-40 synthase
MTLFDPEPTSLPRGGPPPPGCVRVRLTVAYDGRGFRGFAAQPGVKTVGGALATSLERVLGFPVHLTCAGRTDSGVHAWGQVVTFDAREDGLDLPATQRSVNRLCAPAIVIRDAAVAAPEFDARRSALARCYRYSVLNTDVPDPFSAAVAWQVEEPLSLTSLRLSCDAIVGEHDFTSFCRIRRDRPDASMTRTVHDARWLDEGNGRLRFDIQARSFCHQMVRALVGTMVDIGRGRKRAGDMASILSARDRSEAGNLAPAHGLCLWEVVYPPA